MATQAIELVAAGMICQRCGSARSHVTHTRPLVTGSIRRYRSCLDCSRRFTTYEVTALQAAAHRHGNANGVT